LTKYKPHLKKIQELKHSIKVLSFKHTHVHAHTSTYTHAHALPFQIHIKKDKYLSRVEIKGYKSTVIGPNEDPTAKTYKLFRASFDIRFELLSSL